MSRNKRLVAKLSSLIVFILGITFFSFSGSSYASTPFDFTCAKTKAAAHPPLKVATPNDKAAQVDRIFTLNTNCGKIIFKAFGQKAPMTVIAMTALAKAGYFDHSLCHRITTSGFFVLQCGDPAATGRGVPPFYYGNENIPSNTLNNYPAGTIAMANRGVADSDSSQFFIVYKDTTLAPNYTIWGVVIKGLDIVKKVATQGVVGGGTDGTPKQTIAIESVSVK